MNRTSIVLVIDLWRIRLMSQIKNMLNDLLVDLFNHILLLEEQSLQRSGVTLSMTEIHVIEAIEKSPSKKMSDIANKLKITTGTLTVAIKKLESKGYVIRRKDEIDKRIVLASLTDLGHAALSIHDAFHVEMIDDIVAQVTSQEGRVLISTLGRVKGFLNEKYD